MSKADCPKCRKPHVTRFGTPACRGHISTGPKGQPIKERSGQPCRNPARLGQRVCGHHGGRKAAAAEIGKRKHAEAQATKIMRRFGEPIDTTPTEALLDTVKWTAGYVAWLRDKVASLRTDSQLVWGQTRAKIGGEDHGVTHAAGPNTWLVLLGEWSDRLVKVCTAAISAGIEERRVRIAEAQGQLVADVIKAILADLELDDGQRARVAEVVPRHLRLLSGGAA